MHRLSSELHNELSYLTSIHKAYIKSSFSFFLNRFIKTANVYNNKMFGQIQYFQRGTVYRIINRKTRRCLSVVNGEVSSSSLEQDSEQLWILSQIRNDEFELVQMKEGDVLAWIEGKPEIKLQKGKMRNNQLWSFERAEIINQLSLFWIKPAKNIGFALCASALNEKIKISSIDQTLQICLWEILPCSPNEKVFKGLSVFYSDLSKLVLDIPEHSHKEGVNVIQYRYSGGGNQRWMIQAYQNQNEQLKEFTVKNYCTGLFLTASFFKLGFKATQTIFNCGPDQRWKLLPVKNNIFLLQSVSNESYYLGVNNEKGGSQITMTQELDKARWIIEGYHPAR